MENQDSKSALRKRYLKQRNNEDNHRGKSEKICLGLIKLIELYAPKKVFSFYPYSSEVNLTLFHEFLHGKGIPILLPRITSRKGEMEFATWEKTDSLCENNYGILEPDEDALVDSPESESLIIVPALAVDEMGVRLGYGGGYYDRYLSNCPKVKLIVPLFQNQITKGLPRDDHDILVDAVITELNLLKF